MRYDKSTFLRDVFAGITIGIIAIPLSMALAIASGVAPQYGLYSAVIAGILIPLTGGSRFSVSGPTAAFVVILFPITQQYGLAGLLTASVLAGILQIIMAQLRLGRYIEYIPEPVTLGFTAGIAVVIVTLQIKDLFGLSIDSLPSHFVDKVTALVTAIPDCSMASLGVGIVTLLIMVFWPRFKNPVPAHLPAAITGTVLAFYLNEQGHEIATISSTFSFTLPDGSDGNGIPPVLPEFELPWQRSDGNNTGLKLGWKEMEDLLAAAFAIAMLGAIESLLCAVVLDGMTGKKHSANSELLGQGIGNIVAPFFGGITATAAIARSAANVKAGAQTPIAALLHGVVVLIAIISLSSVLGYLPMATMAALLIVVAWNMSEAPKAAHLLKNAPINDIFVFLLCFSLTVLFDMVIAITAGIVLASLLFMKNMAEMTKVNDITHNNKLVDVTIPAGWKVFKINGPLFFAAADRVFGELSLQCNQQKGMVLYLDGVTILDIGGLSALYKFLAKCANTNTKVYLADFQYQPLKTLAKANFRTDPKVTTMYSTLADALKNLPAQNKET